MNIKISRSLFRRGGG